MYRLFFLFVTLVLMCGCGGTAKDPGGRSVTVRMNVTTTSDAGTYKILPLPGIITYLDVRTNPNGEATCLQAGGNPTCEARGTFTIRENEPFTVRVERGMCIPFFCKIGEKTFKAKPGFVSEEFTDGDEKSSIAVSVEVNG